MALCSRLPADTPLFGPAIGRHYLMLGFLGPWPDAHANSIAHREKGPTWVHTPMTILPIVGISDVEYRLFCNATGHG